MCPLGPGSRITYLHIEASRLFQCSTYQRASMLPSKSCPPATACEQQKKEMCGLIDYQTAAGLDARATCQPARIDTSMLKWLVLSTLCAAPCRVVDASQHLARKRYDVHTQVH